jgi:glycosyltransferase involved in cell wall biosynthesis
LRAIGGFAAASGAVHDQAARRLLDQGRIVLVAEMLCGSPTAVVPSSERPGVLGRVLHRIGNARRALRRARQSGPIAVMASLGAGPAYARLTDALRRWPVGVATTHRQRGPQRIAYVLWHYPILSETFIRRELRALRALGLDIIVVADAPELVEPDAAAPIGDVVYLEPLDRRRLRRTLRQFMRRPGALFDRGVFVASRKYGHRKLLGDDIRVLREAVHLAGVLREQGVTHVHAPWADRHAFLALVAARLADATFSLNLRAHDIHSSQFAFAIAEKIAAARFAVTNSRYNRDHLIALAGPVVRERVHVIYNGLDLERFVPGERRREPGRVPRLLAVGRLVQQKGFDWLLEACALLRDRGVEFECHIIGGAAVPDESSAFVRLQVQQRRLGLDQVRFLGPQPLSTVLDAYAQADVFVLPCVVTPDGGHDVTPNALLEAMAMSLPVVSTPVGAIPEIVDNGANGLLVPPMDAEALAAAVERLLGDPELCERLGAAARTKIEERFDISRNALRYAELFRDSVR